jgi:hypothetical protein
MAKWRVGVPRGYATFIKATGPERQFSVKGGLAATGRWPGGGVDQTTVFVRLGLLR